MIEIKNLSKKFGSSVVLDQVSINVKQGEILGFLGPNGAGKSTTMKIITSFWTPSSGTVKIDGIDVTKDSLATRAKIGYLPETVPLYEDMRVYEYLRFVAEMRGIDKDKLKDRLKRVIADCGLKTVVRKPIEELSKGYRQRVGLAQAIMHEPDILILDEPTTGLDPNQIVEIRDLIKKIGREKTVIFSTHILSEVSATCDRTVIIHNGKIVAEGTPDELQNRAGQGEVVEIKLKAPAQALDTLKQKEGIEKAEKADEKDGVLSLVLHPAAGQDIRETVFRAAVDNNWVLLEMSRKSRSLEDVFRQLTTS